MARRTRRRNSTQPASEPTTPQTREFGRHHEIAKPDRDRAAWSKLTRLDQLKDGGTIDAAEWQAGDQYRSHVESAEGGATKSGWGEGGGGSGCPTASRLDAASSLSRARSILTGAQRVGMDGIASDLSWPVIGSQIGCGKDAARSITIEALRVLADMYGFRARRSRMRAVHLDSVISTKD